MCDLENLLNEEAIARDWAAAPSKKKLQLKDKSFHSNMFRLLGLVVSTPRVI
jgi:hypothetical protein